MLKNLCAGRPGLSPAISSQFTLEMCAAAQNRKVTKTTYFKSAKLFKIIDVNIPGKHVTSMSVSTCNGFYAIDQPIAINNKLLGGNPF